MDLADEWIQRLAACLLTCNIDVMSRTLVERLCHIAAVVVTVRFASPWLLYLFHKVRRSLDWQMELFPEKAMLTSLQNEMTQQPSSSPSSPSQSLSSAVTVDARLLSGKQLALLHVDGSWSGAMVKAALAEHLADGVCIQALVLPGLTTSTFKDGQTIGELGVPAGPQLLQVLVRKKVSPGRYVFTFTDSRNHVGHHGPQTAVISARYDLVVADRQSFRLEGQIRGIVERRQDGIWPKVAALHGVRDVDFHVDGHFSEDGEMVLDRTLPKPFAVQIRLANEDHSIALAATMPCLTEEAGECFGHTAVQDIILTRME